MAYLKKYKLYVFVGVMMVVEAVGILFFLPGSAPAVEETGAAAKGNAASAEYFECELAAAKLHNTIDPEAPVSIDYKVYAVVPKQAETEFKDEVERKKFRIREAVATVMRRAHTDWLQEPSLVTLKRQIKEAVADVVGRDKDYVDKIVIPDFKMMEL